MKKHIQHIQELDRNLYYEEGSTEKYRGVEQELWKNISKAVHGQTSEISSKYRWICEKLKLNYTSWQKLTPKERIPAIRKNLRSLLTELQKYHPQDG